MISNLMNCYPKQKEKLSNEYIILNTIFLKKESIVDLDVKSKGIKLGKKSFLNLEITLFVQEHFDTRSKELRHSA